MKQIEREEIRQDIINKVYKKSWTYERLSEDEKNNIVALLRDCKLYGNNKKQIGETLHDVYSAFLTALNYKPSGWRGE